MKLPSIPTFFRAAVFSVIVAALTPQCGIAQSVDCGVPYAKQDREELQSYLVNDLRMMWILTRLSSLATLSEVGNFSSPQRMALNSEYQALIMEIDFQGSQPVPGFRPRTNAWMRRIVNSDLLGLTGTDILTTKSASAANAANYEASRRFYLCY